MAKNIHPTAYIATDVVLGDDVTVGPFAVIETGVEMGANCQIGAHAVVHGHVKMGVGNILHPHAVLGGLPQDTAFKASTDSWLIIGDNNNFREGFTAHRASKENEATQIGSGCYFMNNSHVAHDCTIGNNTIFANNVAIGGHVEVGSNVFMGGAVVVHQFCRGFFCHSTGHDRLKYGCYSVYVDWRKTCQALSFKHHRFKTLGYNR